MSLFPIIAPAAAVPVTISYTASAGTNANATAYTFSSQAIGTAASGRKVVVGASCRRSAGAAATVSSLTIGGVSASSVVAAPTDGSNDRPTELWQATVSSGTTGDIVVTWNAAALNCQIGVWAVYDAASAADDTASSVADPMNASLDCPANGVIIGKAISGGGGSAATHAWTNLTENFDSINPESEESSTGGSEAFTAAQTGLSITCDPSVSSVANGMALASWGPA